MTERLSSTVSGVASIHFFGVGEGWPSPDRCHASFLHEWSKGGILMDCGEGVDTAFKRSGVSYDQIDAVVLSHMHSDHVGSFSLFIQSMWLEGRKKPLTVFAPAKGIPALKAWLKATFVFSELIKYPIRWLALESGKSYEVGDATLQAYGTSHLESLEDNFGQIHKTTAYDAYAFVLEYYGFRIGHSNDIGCVEDLDPLFAQPLDILICECSHIESDILFDKLQGQPIRKLVLVHLHREYWKRRAGLLRTASAKLRPMTVVIPDDDFLIDL
jgi:ribonuclease Z